MSSDNGAISKSDANDYSRFDEIDDSDDEMKGDKDEKSEPKLSFAESFSNATSLKESGNQAFKDNDLSLARERYEEALKLLKTHEETIFNDINLAEAMSEARKLNHSLVGNMAMVCLKLEDFKGAIINSNLVLEKEPNNIKALFRRGMANFKLGNLENAKVDLQKSSELDPDNVSSKKELNLVNKAIKEKNAKDKAVFGSMFSKGSMYSDREQEMIQKRKKAEEEKQKELDDWTKSKLKRREQGLDEQTFEDWKKEKEALKKEQDKERSNSTNPSSEQGVVPKPITSRSTYDEDVAEYDEEDEKILAETKKKGYCYFKNQQTQEQKDLIGNITPKSLSQSNLQSPELISRINSNNSSDSLEKVAASSWNTAGTWEERDMTQYVKDRLSALCNKSCFENDIGKISVTSIKSSEGDAQIIIARSKKRHVYDFNLCLEFEINLNNLESEKSKTYKGTLTFPEISPISNYESNFNFKKSYPASIQSKLDSLTNGLRLQLVENFRSFDLEYKGL